MAKWNAPSPPTVAVVPADDTDEKSETKEEETHLVNGTDKVSGIFFYFRFFLFCLSIYMTDLFDSLLFS